MLGQKEGFKKPAGVREMPLCGTGLRARLHHLVLCAEGGNQQFGLPPDGLILLQQPRRVFLPFLGSRTKGKHRFQRRHKPVPRDGPIYRENIVRSYERKFTLLTPSSALIRFPINEESCNLSDAGKLDNAPKSSLPFWTRLSCSS